MDPGNQLSPLIVKIGFPGKNFAVISLLVEWGIDATRKKDPGKGPQGLFRKREMKRNIFHTKRRRAGPIIPCTLLLGVLFAAIPGFGQKTEFGGMAGASYYIGDLNPYRHYGKTTNFAAGGIFRHNMNKRYSLKLAVLYGTVEGDDALARTQRRKERNLHFRSSIIEASATMELNFLEYSLGSMDHPYSPYLFAGLALFRMNPKAKYEGQWYALQPLGTEGQGTSTRPETEKYSLTNFSIPFGAGFRANITPRVAFSLEWGFRKTYTDHLDDVSGSYAPPDILREENGSLSAKLADRRLDKDQKGGVTGHQRGNSRRKDWYSFSGVMITFMLGEKPSVCNSAIYN